MDVKNDRSFTLVVRAMGAFTLAQSLAALIRDLELGERDQRTAAILGAICGHYAAPFMASNRIGKLPDSLVPRPFRDLHADMLKLRTKLFLHLDTDVDFAGQRLATNLRVTVKQDADHFGIEADTWTPSPGMLDRIAQLLEHLLKVLNGLRLDYVTKYMPRAVVAPGRYRLKTGFGQFELTPLK